MHIIETPRLLLRTWKEDDLHTFRQMNADREVMRYFPATLTSAETDRFYNAIQTEFLTCGYGWYAVEDKENREFIGFIGLHRATFAADFTPCTEIGWRLKKEAWGKGYATEGAAACLNYGFNACKLSEIFSFTAEINQPSQRVMNKIGMRLSHTFDHPNVPDGHPLRRHVLYHITADDLSLSASAITE